jgi:hypothetical protein
MTASPEPTGYPFPKLKVDVDEKFVAKVVLALGGEVLDGSRIFPEGVKPVDFLLDGYALEFKTLDTDPLVSHGDERPAKILDFASAKLATGELKMDGNDLRITGKASQEYWRKFLGVSVGRQFEKAAKQIRSTRDFLGKPDLKGAVFLVNTSAPFIDPNSLVTLVQVQQRRPEFADAINVAIYFSIIPGILNGRPILPAGYTPENSGHDGFAQKFLAGFQQSVAKALGKEGLEQTTHDKPIQPLRMPVTFDDGSGRKVTFH